MDSIKELVLTEIQNNLPLTIPIEKLEDSDDLRDYGMDSLNCIHLIIILEEDFDILIPVEKLGIMSMLTLDSICKLINECVGGTKC
jgi:acyl carrier protein